MKKRAKQLAVGDRVTWNTSRGRTIGKVEKKLTAPTHIETLPVSASKRAPEYLVRSEKSGKRAAHKAKALKQV